MQKQLIYVCLHKNVSHPIRIENLTVQASGNESACWLCQTFTETGDTLFDSVYGG